MIPEIVAVPVQCPYCWQTFDLLIDASIEHQVYIEDCEICCQPINLSVEIGADNRPRVLAEHQDA